MKLTPARAQAAFDQREIALLRGSNRTLVELLAHQRRLLLAQMARAEAAEAIVAQVFNTFEINNRSSSSSARRAPGRR